MGSRDVGIVGRVGGPPAGGGVPPNPSKLRGGFDEKARIDGARSFDGTFFLSSNFPAGRTTLPKAHASGTRVFA
jgi:hypothetical protein